MKERQATRKEPFGASHGAALRLAAIKEAS